MYSDAFGIIFFHLFILNVHFGFMEEIQLVLDAMLIYRNYDFIIDIANWHFIRHIKEYALGVDVIIQGKTPSHLQKRTQQA